MDFSFFGWSQNPFTLNIIPELFVGYRSQLEKIRLSLERQSKFTLLLGGPGTGKTALLRYLSIRPFSGYQTLYIPKPPREEKGWEIIFNKLVSRFSFRKYSLYELPEKLKKKFRKKPLLLLLDEGYETGKESLEWLRTLTDHCDSLFVLLASLPDSEFSFSLLKQRIGERVELKGLDRLETAELIKRRIEWAGGQDIRPFSLDSIEVIYNHTLGVPRQVLKCCSEVVYQAMERGISIIDSGFLRQVSNLNGIQLKELSEKQRRLLFALDSKSLTPTQLADQLEWGRNRDNAMRAVNNMLRRLMGMGLVERERVGKQYRYKTTAKFEALRKAFPEN